MTVPGHLQTTQTARKLHQTVSKDIVLTKRFSKQFLATSCHFKHSPAKVVKGQTQRAQTSTQLQPQALQKRKFPKKQALGEPYAVHVRCTPLFTEVQCPRSQRSTARTARRQSSLWPDCTLSPLSKERVDRSVTQSFARDRTLTQLERNRRSCPP